MELPKDKNGKLMSVSDVGGYPLYYLDGKDNTLCASCSQNWLLDPDKSFRPRIVQIHWEGEPKIWEQCNTMIYSAYGYDTVEE